VLAHGDGGVGFIEAGRLGEALRRLAGKERLGEVLDRLVRGFQEAARLRLEPEGHDLPGFLVQLHQVCDDADDVGRVRLDDVVSGDARLEAERRALNRRLDSVRREVGKQSGNLHRVLDTILGPPVRLVDLFLDDLLLENAVDERVGRIQIQIVVGKELLEVGTLRRIRREGRRRRRRRAQADAELLVRRHARLHLRQISIDALPQLLPVVRRVHERRVGEMSKTLAEIHRFLRFHFSIY
jgi:hypothetical protein